MVGVELFIKELECGNNRSCMLRLGNVFEVISWEMLNLLLRNSLKDFMLIGETLRILLVLFQLCFSFCFEMFRSLKRLGRRMISERLDICVQS